MVNVATGNAITIEDHQWLRDRRRQQRHLRVATPETAKINTIANILASCINGAISSAPGCTILFANAAPAARKCVHHRPTRRHLHCSDEYSASCLLHALQPHQRQHDQSCQSLCSVSSQLAHRSSPSLAAAPTDWTIAISYASTSTLRRYNARNGHLIHSVQDLAVDAYGDIWLANNEAGGNLSVLDRLQW